MITTDELFRICVDAFPLSASRKPIFENLEEVMRKLAAKAIVGDLWIDGSFVTTKFNPRDVDLVLCISSNLYDNCSAEQRALLDWFESDVLHTDYRCDGYISIEWPSGHRLHADGIASRDYWSNLFGHTRDGFEKGIPVVQLSGKII
jgi:hypothetical protein